MTLALISRQFPDWAVLGGGLLLLLFASTLRFDHLVTLTVLALSITEIEIPGYRELSHYIRQISRLARWFLFLAIAMKGAGAVLRVRAGGIPTHPIRKLVLLILLLASISTAYSMDRQVTIAATLILALVFLCAFVFLWRVVDSEQELSRFVHGIYRAIWPLIVISVLFMLSRRYTFMEGRFGGVFRNANGLGLISAALFPIAIWEVRNAGRSGKRFIAYLVVFCILLAVVTSKSRSAMIGVVMSGGVLLLYRYRIGFAAFVVAAMTSLFIFVAVGGAYDFDPQTKEELSALIRVESLEDLGGRLDKWDLAWIYIQEKPFLGYGYGTSRLVTRGRLEGNILEKAGGLHGLDFHSSHVQTALELGLLGVVLLEIMVITILTTGFSLFRNMRSESLPLLGFALFASLLVMLGDSFVHGWLFSPGSGMSFMFWLYTALVTRTAVVAAQRRREAREGPVRAPSMLPA